MTINTTPRFGLKVWSDDADAFEREDFVTSLTAIESLAARMDSGLRADRPAAAIARRLHYSTDTEEVSLDTGAGWKSIAGTPWGDYVPTIMGGYTLGVGGTIIGRTRRDALKGTVEWWARITLGTGFTIGASYGVSIPVAADAERSSVDVRARITNAGTRTYQGGAELGTDRALLFFLGTGGGFLDLNDAGKPFTLDVGDILEGGGSYEPA